MKTSQVKATILLAIVNLILVINSFLLPIFNNYTLCIFIAVLIGISVLLFGFSKEKSRFIKDMNILIIIYTMFFYFIIYLSGLFFGFTRNSYSLKFLSIISNILPVLIIIPLTEILRYTINNKVKDKLWILILSIVTFTLVDMTFIIRTIDFFNFDSYFVLSGLYILPSLSKNMLMTYMNCKIGYKSNILYRYIMELPTFLLPLLPDFGNYIESIIYISLPIFILLRIYKLFKKIERDKIIISRKKRYFNFIKIGALSLLIVLIGLTSRYFKYQLIVIATGSMEPYIYRGDAVVVDKLKENEIRKLESGTVIAFNVENKIVVHRIFKVYKTGNKVFFKTKGDNNNSPDDYLIEPSDVIGPANINLKYIGYPSVILYEKLGK